MLSIELAPGEKLYVPGGYLEFQSEYRTRVLVVGTVPCLRGGLVIAAADYSEDLPRGRRLYYWLQSAYIGADAETRSRASSKVSLLIKEILADPEWSRSGLAHALERAYEQGDLYRAIMTVRALRNIGLD